MADATPDAWWRWIEEARGGVKIEDRSFTFHDFEERADRWAAIVETRSAEELLEIREGLSGVRDALTHQATWDVMYLVIEDGSESALLDVSCYLASWGPDAVAEVLERPEQLEKYLNPSSDPRDRRHIGLVGLGGTFVSALNTAIHRKIGKAPPLKRKPTRGPIHEDHEGAQRRFPDLARKYGHV